MDAPTQLSPSAPPPEIAFCLELGRAYQASGIPAHRFEEALARVSQRLGLEGQFFALPTAFFATLGWRGQQWTFFQRSLPGDVELERLSDLQETTDALIAGRLGAA
ncbi:MAG: threonine/serine exporter family protein, partial [Acidobacteriota bacterium]|nr:threonine/serine exporter family protein [Acidobacteriota bacterium]